ncbi:uncharacterized protein LOC141586227 [Silene latifolia]|uniref:uncharacterized protein LOC141586227 n=1 Tax=Silene latifolia TaxID=37657 RepID=UPI003D7738FA
MQDACKTTIDFGDKKPRPARKISGATIDISHLCRTENKVYLDAYIKELLPENQPKTNNDTSARRSSEDTKTAEVVQNGAVLNEATSPELSQEKKTLQDIIDPELRQKVLDTMTEKDILEINRILRETGLTYEEISSRFEAASEIHLAMSNPRIQQVLVEICSSGNPMTGIKFRSNAEAMDLVMKLVALFPEIGQLYGLC